MQKRQRNPRKRPRLDLSRYRGQWVAIHPRTRAIVSHDVSCQEAERAAVAAGVARPLLMPVPKSSAFFVGRGCQTGFFAFFTVAFRYWKHEMDIRRARS